MQRKPGDAAKTGLMRAAPSRATTRVSARQVLAQDGRALARWAERRRSPHGQLKNARPEMRSANVPSTTGMKYFPANLWRSCFTWNIFAVRLWGNPAPPST